MNYTARRSDYTVHFYYSTLSEAKKAAKEIGGCVTTRANQILKADFRTPEDKAKCVANGYK